MWFITISDEKSLSKPHVRFEANGDLGGGGTLDATKDPQIREKSAMRERLV